MVKKYNKKMPMVWTVALLFAWPMALMGQELKFVDEITQTEYKNILEWQSNKSKYDALATECDTLKKVVEQLKSDEAGIVKQKQELQGNLAKIYPNAKIMYDQCDVVTLNRHKGMLGNPDKEQQLAALLVCHQAEQALAKRYDEKTVKSARESLKNPQVVVKEVANDIDTRLRLYEDKTTNLKKALQDAADTLTLSQKINIPKGKLTSKTKEMIVIRFFDELEKGLDPDLLYPEKYPFLYQKLMESIKVLTDNKTETGEDLIQIINQTITKISNEL